MQNIKEIKLKTVDSTNKYGFDNLNELEDKTVIIAETQYAGKGRQGRKWISDDSKNAFVSIVLKPEHCTTNQGYPLTSLTQYLSVIICEVLEFDYGVKANIKWPNDILVNGAKICGILCEAKTKGSCIEGIVLGFGVNLNLSQETLEQIDQNATSLNMIVNKEIDPENFVENILSGFFSSYEKFINLGFNFIKEKYVERCNFIGQVIKIKTDLSIDDYVAEGINDDGTLLVSDKEYNKKKILSGDVIFVSSS